MINFSKLWVYRMTHIDNVSHIAMNGLTHVDSEKIVIQITFLLEIKKLSLFVLIDY